jgi:aspartyl-tRNA(Asn)/glutamyl-tRNA(Gln) amidotransferase subunit A
MQADPCDLTITELAAAYRAQQLSPVDATRACLDRIARVDPDLRAFIAVAGERALAQAQAAAEELERGRDRGPLHGVPIALKDLIDVAGMPTTAASAVCTGLASATEDAAVVARLRDAGAVILGKLNLHEFAYGGSGVVGHFPPARNPHSAAHICGGSSSGSAAAVGGHLCVAALGTDTSGSIRLPAALCGVVGLKPSYGLVSLRGVIPLASSYDHVGPLTRTVADAALVLQAIAGHDPDDPASATLPVPDYAQAVARDVRGVRIGVPRPHFYDGLDAEIAGAVEDALASLATLGAEIHEIALPVDDDRTVFRAEAYAVHRHWVETVPDRYQPETLRRILTGATVSAADYLERQYDLQRLRRAANAWFVDIDVIVTPTVPVQAPRFDELAADPAALRPRELLLMRNTRPFDIWGTPALTVPCGVTRQRLPIGLQLAARVGADAEVLRVGAALERAARDRFTS